MGKFVSIKGHGFGDVLDDDGTRVMVWVFGLYSLWVDKDDVKEFVVSTADREPLTHLENHLTRYSGALSFADRDLLQEVRARIFELRRELIVTLTVVCEKCKQGTLLGETNMAQYLDVSVQRIEEVCGRKCQYCLKQMLDPYIELQLK